MVSAIKRFFEKNPIENLTAYIVLLTCFVTGYSIYSNDPNFGNLNLDIIQKSSSLEIILQIFIYPFKIESSFLGSPWLGMVFYLYFFFFLGSMLESDLGPGMYNLYMLQGLLVISIFSFLSVYFPFKVSAEFLYLSVFLPVCYRNSNMEILLFFIIPIKLKWFGFFSLFLAIITVINNVISYSSFLPILGLIIGLSNTLTFYGREVWIDLRYKFKKQNSLFSISRKFQNTQSSFHKCSICGKTELDDPRLEFRFCIHCADHEYCSEHLNTHTHK